MSNQLTLTLAALSYIARGWRVFPCCWPDQHSHCGCGRGHSGRDVGKAPLTAHGLHDATTDETVVRRWWGQNSRANIAIRTGAISGLVVLDVDSDKGGEDSLVTLQAQHGLVPESIESLTGGGGRHILLAHPGPDTIVGNTTQLAGYVGLDVRGDGGYIIAPGSLHVSGRHYCWEIEHLPGDVALAPIPDWLMALMSKRPRAENPPQPSRRPLLGLSDAAKAAQALSCLASSRCADYEAWLEVGMSLQDLGDVGLALWDRWSESCPEKYQPGECARRWQTFTRDGLHLGSLLSWARTDTPKGPTIRGVDV